MSYLRRWIWTPAALLVLLAQPARGDVPDGGVPVDAAPATAAPAEETSLDAAPAPAPPPAAPKELQTPRELSANTQNDTTAPLIGPPTPDEAEPPRPITRRLWFWMAITGVIVAGVFVGMALYNPNTTKPECPPGFVCPL